jgi:hypothetical protein
LYGKINGNDFSPSGHKEQRKAKRISYGERIKKHIFDL